MKNKCDNKYLPIQVSIYALGTFGLNHSSESVWIGLNRVAHLDTGILLHSNGNRSVTWFSVKTKKHPQEAESLSSKDGEDFITAWGNLLRLLFHIIYLIHACYVKIYFCWVQERRICRHKDVAESGVVGEPIMNQSSLVETDILLN